MKKKRFLNVIVAMLVVAGLFSNGIEVQAKSFPEVPSDSWFAPYVDYVSNAGLITGDANGNFNPYNEFTRGEVATSFYRLTGSPNVKYAPLFHDVPDGVFYSKAITWCYYNGIITGYENGNFGPNDPITREQYVTILYRYSKYRGFKITANGDYSNYPDANKVSGFAKDAMKFALQYGIISGDQGYLNPQGTVNRAVGATMLTRYDRQIVQNTHTNPGGL